MMLGMLSRIDQVHESSGSVVATTVKVGATVVGTTVDVAAAGVKAVSGSDDEKKD